MARFLRACCLLAAAMAVAFQASTRPAARDAAGFVPLFDGEGVPAGWVVTEWSDVAVPVPQVKWTVTGGVLRSGERRGTWLISEREYGDFVLELEIRLTELGNSGIALRAPMRGDPAFDGLEFQVADFRYNPEAKDSELTGGLYRAIAPRKQAYRPTEWNQLRLELRGPRLKATLNGEVIQDVNLDEFDQPVPRHDGTMAPPIKDRPRRGHVGFQHLSRDGAVHIRNARIMELDAGSQAVLTVGRFAPIYDPSAGEAGKWYINDHTIVFDPRAKEWHLFGITHAEPADPLDEDHFAHATAHRLGQNPWEKRPFALSADAAAGETHLWAPHVIRHDGKWWMFYCAGGESSERYRIHVATSGDLETWTRHAGNPILIDGFDARDPFVLRDGDRWILYYTATTASAGGWHVVKAITSDDLLHWSEPQIVFNSGREGTFGGPTESPFIVRRGEFYYLFCGSWKDYSQTRVFRSRDPMRWTADDHIATIPAHAPEVVRDTDGRWYITHCGWGQGGVFLAPLTWNDGQDEAETSLPPSGAE